MLPPEIEQRMDTMPFAMVTVPLPLLTSVTLGPVPLPPPGMFASAESVTAHAPAMAKMVPRNENFIGTTGVRRPTSVFSGLLFIRVAGVYQFPASFKYHQF